MKKGTFLLLLLTTAFTVSTNLFAQQKSNQTEADRVKMEHLQIGIDDSQKNTYKHTLHPDAQWFPEAGFGMFIHWSIASVKELDLSWPMMSGTQIGWSSKKPSQDSVDRFIANGDFFAGHHCKINQTCITPNQYWDLAKDFNPKSFNPETWVKLATEAGMQYVVLTARHHDGFALWPSKYGNFNTNNYLGGRDFVKEFVAACHKYGVKVGLYYSGPDWHFDRDFQSFMYYGVQRDYKNIPSIDANLQVRTTMKTEVEKQQHYEEVAAYLSGQIEELLTNYGKIDMIWFDGGPSIPKGNVAWNHCITMDRIHQLQPGIVVSPRFFGYGDYKTFEGDKSVPKTKQNNWAELCATAEENGWGYTKSHIKSTPYLINQLAVCRSNNANLLLNFGPTKDGEFTNEMISRLHEMAEWSKINQVAITGTQALNSSEESSVPATASERHRYLFVMPIVSNKPSPQALPQVPKVVTFKTNNTIKGISVLGKTEGIKYTVENGVVTIQIPSAIISENGSVVDVEVN